MPYRLRHFVHGALLAGGLTAFPTSAAAGEPLCDWLDGLGRSAQAATEGSAEAASFAHLALSARPQGPAGERARLSLAIALAVEGRDGERLQALQEALPQAAPGVRGALLEQLGAARFDAGDPTGAAEAYRAAVAEGSPAVADRARHRLASSLQDAGLHAEAVEVWRPLAGGRLAEGLPLAERLGFARALRAAGGSERAAAILRAVWTGLPERPEAEAAAADLLRWRGEGDPITPFTAEERVGRAFRLVSMGRAPDAVVELAEAERAVPTAPAGLLALAKGTLSLAQGRPAEAADLAAPHLRSRHPGIRRGAQLILARVAMRQRRTPEAIAAWRAVAASRAPVPGLSPSLQASLRDDAQFLAAWLHFDAGDLRRAAAELNRLAASHPSSRRADDARWFAAWAHLRTGDVEGADAALRRLQRGPAAPQALYWRARIAEDPAARDALLRQAVAADPIGYYGLLACARLGGVAGAPGPVGPGGAKGAPGGASEAGDAERSRAPQAGVGGCVPPPLPAGPPPPELDRLPQAPLLRGAAALAAAGLRDEAVAELAAIASPTRNPPAGGAVAELAAFLGDPLLPFRLTRDQLGLTRRSLPWSFPQAWPHWVGPAASVARVDPALLLAVMRRESGFRTAARSPAGAVGLLQIIPGTAARLTSLLALPAPVAERLEEPEVNIPLGAAYLSLLQERFREPLLAIAAYNAGPSAVLRWQRERPGMPLDEWVESIPFKETREYVKAVVGNWSGFRAAAGAPAPEIDPGAPIPPAGAGVGF